VTFAKRGVLRFLSHHDLMRAFHRALHRAGLPVRMTEGFNRRPRVVFPHALEVGVWSEDEVVEIELVSWIAPGEFARRLAKQLPADLPVREVELAAPRRQSSVAVEAHYDARLGADDVERAKAGVATFAAAESWAVQRAQHDGRVRDIDLRKHVISVSLDGDRLDMRLRLGLPGAARPREVLAAVLDRPVEGLLDVPLTKTRTVLATPT
jgi:radical SAM-linked protein